MISCFVPSSDSLKLLNLTVCPARALPFQLSLTLSARETVVDVLREGTVLKLPLQTALLTMLPLPLVTLALELSLALNLEGSALAPALNDTLVDALTLVIGIPLTLDTVLTLALTLDRDQSLEGRSVLTLDMTRTLMTLRNLFLRKSDSVVQYT